MGKHILNKSDFIRESLGMSDELDSLLNRVWGELSGDKKFHKWSGEYLGESITVHIFILPSGRGLVGSFRVDDSHLREFTIKIDSFDRTTLRHELKHLDRAIRRGMRVDGWYWIKHMGRFVAKNYKHLFVNDSHYKIFLDTLYYCNPDEFEAHYGDIVENLKHTLRDKVEREEKIEFITKTLKESEIYQYYQYYYHNPFNLEDFFKTREGMSFFLQEFWKKTELFSRELDYSIGNLERFRSWFRTTILIPTLGSRERISPVGVGVFNSLIRKTVNNNWKKFGRVYSLFI
jgi:hypothetical protein